jgi:hypothetical protein
MDIENQPQEYKPKHLQLRGMPKDVRDIILEFQKEKKQTCNCQFSMEQTVYMIVRKASKKDE